METIAIILLVLFTLEIIFIFVYSSQKDDSQTEQQGWGPPELPRPSGNTNIFEFPEGPHGYFPPGRRPGRRPGRWDDDDYDFDGDFKKKDKLRRVKFFLVDNYDALYDNDRTPVDSDFKANQNRNEYTVNLDKIDYKKFKDKKLFMVYKPRELTLRWKLMDEDGNKIDKNEDSDGDIKLGKLSKLKDKANGENLILKIKVINDNNNDYNDYNDRW